MFDPKVQQSHAPVLTWYAQVSFKGMPYIEGKVVIWQQTLIEETAAAFMYGIECNGQCYMLTNKFKRFPDGHAYKHTAEGLMYVLPNMATSNMMATPLWKHTSLLSCIAVNNGGKLLFVDEI